MKNYMASLFVAVSAVAFAANANAENSFKPYVGLDYNYSAVDTDAEDLRSNLKYNSFSVNAGTQFNDYFGTEVYYQHSDNDDINVIDDDRIDNVSASFQSYGLDLMGYLPMGCEQEFALIGTVGIGEYIFDKEFRFDKGGKDHGVGYRAGVGAMYNIDSDVAVRALVRYVNFNHIEGIDDMVEYTAGVRYNF